MSRFTNGSILRYGSDGTFRDAFATVATSVWVLRQTPSILWALDIDSLGLAGIYSLQKGAA